MITWSWVCAALSMLAIYLYWFNGAHWEIRHLRTAGIMLAAIGMASGIIAFARRGVNAADKCALVFVFLMCLLSGAWLFMMYPLIKN